jgi:beta-glucanase (GH16 family)
MRIINKWHGVMRRREPMLAVALLASGCGALRGREPAGMSTPTPAAANGGWTQVWRDDFTGPAGNRVSAARWRYDTGTHYPGGPANWGNNELESYTTSTTNVYLDGHGDLAIRPIRNGRGEWTSGRLETRRTNFMPPTGASLAFSARIKLPAGGQGYWPAFWMLGASFRSNVHDWPASGELDAMENIDNQPTVRGTLHCGVVALGGPCREPTGLTATYDLGTPARIAGFHTYTVVWNTKPRRIRWYVDDRLYLAVTPSMIGSNTWRSTFDHGFFTVLNVAIGGLLPGNPTATTVSGRPMLIDNVIVAVNHRGNADPPTPGTL